MVRTNPHRLLRCLVSFPVCLHKAPNPKRVLQMSGLSWRCAGAAGASLQSAMTILELLSSPLNCSEDSMFTEDDILPVVECWAGLVVAGARKERKLAMLMEAVEAGRTVPAPRPCGSSSELRNLVSAQAC